MPRRRPRKKHTGKSPKEQDLAEEETTLPLENENFSIKQSDTIGRFLVASRDIPAGTVIINEDALVVGPVSDSLPVCLGCYITIPDIDTADRCRTCKWPLCSNNCKGLHKTYGHTQEECSELSTCSLKSTNLPKNQLYNALFPLRCLLLRDHQPEKWSILNKMEAHNDIRRKQQSIWDFNQKSIVDRITKEWNITKYTEDEIHTVCGYIEVNAFSIGGDSLNIQGIYPTAFLASHDCVANTSHTDDEEYRMILFTSVKISKGQMITLSYTNSLQGTNKRREHLKKCKFFECSCNRCSDPTELGTYLSALKCQNCDVGRVVPTEPLNEGMDWRCDNKVCNRLYPVKGVRIVINRIENEIKNLNQDSVTVLEAAIRQYSGILHPSHYLIVDLKYTLSQLYGKSAGFLISQMSEAMLERKVQICEDILKTFDIVEPGFTRIRGITMYELHAPLMILTIKRSEKHKISKVELTTNLKRVAYYLRECNKILKFEQKSSQEGIIRSAAEEGLTQLKSWEQVVGKL